MEAGASQMLLTALASLLCCLRPECRFPKVRLLLSSQQVPSGHQEGAVYRCAAMALRQLDGVCAIKSHISI